MTTKYCKVTQTNCTACADNCARNEPRYLSHYGTASIKVSYSLTPMGWYVLALVLIGCAYLVAEYMPEGWLRGLI